MNKKHEQEIHIAVPSHLETGAVCHRSITKPTDAHSQAAPDLSRGLLLTRALICLDWAAEIGAGFSEVSLIEEWNSHLLEVCLPLHISGLHTGIRKLYHRGHLLGVMDFPEAREAFPWHMAGLFLCCCLTFVFYHRRDFVTYFE